MGAEQLATHHDAGVQVDHARVVADQALFSRKVESELGADVVVQWWLINACAIEVPFANLAKVRALPNVARVEPDQAWEPCIKSATNSKNHNADFVHDVLKINGSGGIAVGILDTGQNDRVSSTIARPHRTYFINGDPKNTTGKGIGGSRLVVNTKVGRQPANDTNGHGTEVASVAAGADWGTTGSDNGHAFGANIAGYAIANSLRGSTDTTTMVSGWQALGADRVKHNIGCANLSYTGSPSLLDAAQQALDALSQSSDVLCVVACGNSGSSTARSQGAANGIAVGAIEADTHKMAAFSSRGPLAGSGGRFYPDIVACGVRVVMAQVGNEGTDSVNSGTSMAAPQVCGTAALVRATNTKLTALETKAILLASTRSILKENPRGTRNNFGLGMLRADVAVRLALAKNGVGRGTVSNTNKVQKVTLSVTQNRTYAAVVTWHRIIMTSTTYSNLDIRVLDGTTELAKSNTLVNLYENVTFTAKKTGTVTLEITATSLSVNTQPFAYAFTAVPVPGVVTAFGKGCPGSGVPLPAICQSDNTTRPVAANFGRDGITYAIEITANANMNVAGFEFRCDSRDTASKTMTTYLYDAQVTGPPNKILATGTMLVGPSLDWHRTVFTNRVPSSMETSAFSGLSFSSASKASRAFS